MICDKCDPAGHIGVLEQEFLKREYEKRRQALTDLAALLNETTAGKRSPDRFLGERIAATLKDLDAISHLQIVVGLVP